jgi:glycosyltransferase involved in cell wall biosynthesis
MNISIFAPGIVPPAAYGGTERVIDWLIREFSKLGHRVYFFGPPGSDVPCAEKVNILEFPGENINLSPIDFSSSIPPDTDIVHVHSATDLDYGYPLLKTVHGYPFHRQGSPLSRRDQFDEQYSFVSDAHRKACFRPENPYVHNGIDLDDYMYSEDKDDYFIFMGKLDWGVKGLLFAVKIAMEMDLRLLIAGDFLIPEQFTRQLRGLLTDRIQYIGPVAGQQKAELLAHAKGLFFPVIWPEPFGLVVAEALASGTPVLTTMQGAMPEIMVQGKTGFMCRTIGEMKDYVGQLDSIDPRQCRQRVEDHFTSRHMAMNYLSLYEQVIQKYPHNQLA